MGIALDAEGVVDSVSADSFRVKCTDGSWPDGLEITVSFYEPPRDLRPGDSVRLVKAAGETLRWERLGVLA